MISDLVNTDAEYSIGLGIGPSATTQQIRLEHESSENC